MTCPTSPMHKSMTRSPTWLGFPGFGMIPINRDEMPLTTAGGTQAGQTASTTESPQSKPLKNTGPPVAVQGSRPSARSSGLERRSQVVCYDANDSS